MAVHRYDHLPAIGMTPLLVTALLADLNKSVAAQNANDVFGSAYWKVLAHWSATSSTFAPGGSETGVGSNQRSKASFALRTASSSVSPADATPGNSGKKAAHLFVSGSCSTTKRTFMGNSLM